MNRQFMFYLVGVVVVFITILAPAMTLAAWLTKSSPIVFLLLAALLSIPIFFALWHSLNKSNSLTLRWVWMQLLGLGTVLMCLIIPALFLTAFLDTQTVGWLTLVAWPALSLLAVLHATNINVRKINLSAPQLATKVRLVQISDIHVGSRSPKFLAKVVAQVNHQQPDLTLITGDLLDASAVTTENLKALADIDGPVYMCIGNHERYVDLDKALASITAHGVNILRDAATTVGQLQIIGVDDRDKPDIVPSLLSDIGIDHSLYSILLYHRPDGWQAAIEHGVNLTLAGHTHAGQMFPFGLLVKRQYPNMAGLFTEQEKHLYVSVGTGTWGPIFRLGTHNEMTVIDLDKQ